MTGFTRVTLVGSDHRGDVSVPDDEALGVLLPALLDLLEERPGPLTRPLRLVRGTGAELDLEGSAAAQRLRPGETVRVVRSEEVPRRPR